MLKTTYRPSGNAPSATTPGSSEQALPPEWTTHKAPTGHTYYYNTETKQSTYTRPVAQEREEELVIDYGATAPDRVVQASINALDEFRRSNTRDQPDLNRHGYEPGRFTGGKSYQDQNRDRDRSRPNRQGDRPKSKTPIPECAPWVLIKTKYGRRFVHNTETKESFWKFPSDVMMAVIEMDRIEWERKSKIEEEKKTNAEAESITAAAAIAANKSTIAKTAETEVSGSVVQPSRTTTSAEPAEDYDSDEYEEVEVTDDEAEAEDHFGDAVNVAKRLRVDGDAGARSGPAVGPVEFDEDDIAYQLAAMEGYDQEGDLEEDEVYDEDEDAEEGLALTVEDSVALYRSLLDENGVNPYSTFDSLIDTNTTLAMTIVEDSRWTALPNMAARKKAFSEWSRDRIAEARAAEEAPEVGTSTQPGPSITNRSDLDPFGLPSVAPPVSSRKMKKLEPRVAYLRFLSTHATPKLYWPEFKRKFRKEAGMTDVYFADRDREKLYRDYIGKLKTIGSSEGAKKKEFMALLKSVPTDNEKGSWFELIGDDLKGEDLSRVLPDTLERDVRFYLIPEEQRRAVIKEYVRTLP